MYEQDRHTFAMACLFLALLLALMYVIATPARPQAPTQTPCGPTKQMTDMLKTNFGETPAIAGMANGNTPVLIFTNPKTKTFSITIRRPGGVTCIMTAGESWTAVDQGKEGTNL